MKAIDSAREIALNKGRELDIGNNGKEWQRDTRESAIADFVAALEANGQSIGPRKGTEDLIIIALALLGVKEALEIFEFLLTEFL